MTREEREKALYALRKSTPIMAMTPNEFDDYIKTLNKIADWLEQEPCKEIYNKGWKDGAEATAYHVELCEEENPTIPLSVIEDIKAEIEEESRFCPLTEGLECALEIINKHIADMRGTK